VPAPKKSGDSRYGSNHVVLIGMMGVGKSTIGRALAARLGWEFWDNDEALQSATGRNAAEVQQADGQTWLHGIEDRLLRAALARTTATVYAAAASVVLDPDALKGVVTVWLRASGAREAENVANSGQHHRPLPADPAAVLSLLTAERSPMYAELADIVIDVDGDPAATCDRVIEALQLQTRPR
jgi:shikimate kinase